jgi:hypothetical protein
MLIAAKDKTHIGEIKSQLKLEFDMKDMGVARKILGMEISRDRKEGKLWLSQENYVLKVLERFNMKEARPVSTPLAGHFKLSSEQCPKSPEEKEEMSRVPYASAVGSLMYAMVCTRPDLAHAVSLVSRFMSDPGKQHWEAVKWILRYLRGTAKVGLLFQGLEEGEPKVLQGYVDADYAGDLDQRRSITGYVFMVAGCIISWKAELQDTVALSTTEAEYMAAVEAAKEALWLQGLVDTFGVKQEEVKIHCDSQSAIHLAKDQRYHKRTKHIDIRYHKIREWILEKKVIELVKISTKKNPADMMTKVIPVEKFQASLDFIHVLRR